MSYDNAEPKVLKTLNSSGQVLDDSGNIISDTSDYWVKLYNQTEPKVDKILKSDGTIVDSAGNLIQDTTEFNVKKYNQAEPTPAKYLHADGTIDENAGGGSADLEDNHQTTIDVSTYTEPVEVLPTSGKDGMKKNTVTLTNIPGGVTKLYAFFCESAGRTAYTFTEDVGEGSKVLVSIYDDYSILSSSEIRTFDESTDTITIENFNPQEEYVRDNTKDITL